MSVKINTDDPFEKFHPSDSQPRRNMCQRFSGMSQELTQKENREKRKWKTLKNFLNYLHNSHYEPFNRHTDKERVYFAAETSLQSVIVQSAGIKADKEWCGVGTWRWRERGDTVC